MRRSAGPVLFLVALILAPSVASAQASRVGSSGLPHGIGDDHDATCATDHSDASWDALARFSEARKSGALDIYRAGLRTAAKTAAPADIGDRRNFNVLEDLWTPREFELRDITPFYHLWIAVANLQDVSPDEINGLRDAMLSSTPAGSIKPTNGIMQNNREIFGEMPDFDGDGILDILMYDLKAADGATTVALGYVTSSDLLLGAPEGTGNQRDVLYLDAVEGSSNLTRLVSIASHELTHLIHYNYLGVKREETFIMEGLAEYSMIINGYDTRTAAYLTDPREYLLPMFSWRDGGGPNAFDYSKASLFFRYLGERVGPTAVGNILRNYGEGGLGGSLGVDQVLVEVGYSLAAATIDFHATNRFNDASLDPLFAYAFYRGYGLPAKPSRTFLSQGTVAGELGLHGGSVEYLRFGAVQQIEFAFDTPNPIPENRDRLRTQIRARVVTERYDGARTWYDLSPVDEPNFISGPFRSVDVILVNITGVNTSQNGVKIAYSYTWTAAPAGTATETSTTLPESFVMDPVYPNPAGDRAYVPFELSMAGTPRFSVVDMLGRRVLELDEEFYPAGVHSRELSTNRLPSGVYLVVMESRDVRRTARLVISR